MRASAVHTEAWKNTAGARKTYSLGCWIICWEIHTSFSALTSSSVMASERRQKQFRRELLFSKLPEWCAVWSGRWCSRHSRIDEGLKGGVQRHTWQGAHPEGWGFRRPCNWPTRESLRLGLWLKLTWCRLGSYIGRYCISIERARY